MNYRNLFIIYILLFINICIVYSKKKITLNVIIYSFYDTPDSYYRLLTDGFNEYSLANDLGIDVHLNVLTPQISTMVIENYGNTIDAYINKQSKEFDIYFYYSSYSRKYGEHFEDIRKYIPAEYLNVYDDSLVKETCSSRDGVFVGLPVIMYVSTLFSNQDLLNKYNKKPPKTWDELIDISKYIIENEKKNNVDVHDLIPFNGLFNTYSGSMSLYEFINSYRESRNSTQPELRSKTTMEALEKIKEMKEIFGEDTYKADDTMTQEKLFINGKALFIKYFYNPHNPVFKGTALPGRKEGVSGTIVIPNNLAINKYIKEERKKAASEFLKFVASSETQKKFIIRSSMFSPNMDLYNDTEVCNMIECNIIHDALPFQFMSNDEKLFGDDNYHIVYRENMFEYLYKNKSLRNVLKIIDDYTRIYEFTLNTDDSYAGITIFLVYLILSISIALSLLFIFIKKLENRFKFLSKNLWGVTTLGSLILLSSILTQYGEVKNGKCQLRFSLINVGFVLSICPSLLKLISNFPQYNKISVWFEKNKYVALVIIMVFTVGLNKIFSLSSYTLQNINMSGEGHYLKCYMKGVFGNIIYSILLFYDFFIIFISLALIFMEWNLKETALDIKYLATALFMDTLSLILLIIFDKIVFKSYIIYNIILALNVILFSVSNHIFIYLVRILPIFRPDSEYEDPRTILGKITGSNTESKLRSMMGSSSHNKRSTRTSSYNKRSMASSSTSSSHNKYSIGNSPYVNAATSPYDTNASSPYSKHSTPVSSYNVPSMPPTSFNKISRASSSSNKNSAPASSYNKTASIYYNRLSNKINNNYPITYSDRSKVNKIRSKIMNYHNQTDISFD